MRTADTPRALLRRWLEAAAAPEALAWLDAATEKLAAGAPDRDLYLAVSLAPRKLGKADLPLDEAALAAAEAARPGWRPAGWSADQAGRLVLLLALPDPARLAMLVDQLCRTGDLGELVTFYRGLPLYPEPERYLARAREAARSNMKAVFDALAHHNPYPAECFDELAWNHLVLKALFVGSPLDPIQGLDRRANPTLMRMLCDYAHERWAAGRPVSPDLWRCVGRFADAAALADLQRALRGGSERERRAAALALHDNPKPEARAILQEAPELAAAATEGRIAWNEFGPG